MAIVSIQEDQAQPEPTTLSLGELKEGKHYLVVEGQFKGRILFCTHRHQGVRGKNGQDEYEEIIAFDSAGALWFPSDIDRYYSTRLREVNLSITYSFVN